MTKPFVDEDGFDPSTQIFASGNYDPEDRFQVAPSGTESHGPPCLDGARVLDSPGTAKNVITAGTAKLIAGSLPRSYTVSDAVGVFGPTKDGGRIKPDILAPAENLVVLNNTLVGTE